MTTIRRGRKDRCNVGERRHSYGGVYSVAAGVAWLNSLTFVCNITAAVRGRLTLNKQAILLLTDCLEHSIPTQ